ncbi:1042_t:CDS:1, partial [Funneliformis geosporum]
DFNMTEEKYDLARGLAKRLVKSRKSIRRKGCHSDLNEMLRKCEIDSNSIKKISPFVPELMKINDKDEELEQYITEIKCRIKVIGALTSCAL